MDFDQLGFVGCESTPVTVYFPPIHLRGRTVWSGVSNAT